jgi:hypothetical protein
MLGIATFFLLASTQMNWGFTIISFGQSALFWRKSSRSVVPIPLYVLSLLSIAINLAATVIDLSYWWSAFLLNRLFDLMLLYVAGCAIYRIVRMRYKQRGAPPAHPWTSEFFAAA